MVLAIELQRLPSNWAGYILEILQKIKGQSIPAEIL